MLHGFNDTDASVGLLLRRLLALHVSRFFRIPLGPHSVAESLPSGNVMAAKSKSDQQAFKEGDVRFLICTDVAARGIDIQGLPFVVNMTLPDRCATIETSSPLLSSSQC